MKKIKKANRGERIDWVMPVHASEMNRDFQVLQDSFIESAGEYVAAVASHCKYFGNPDFAFFVRDKINDEYHSSADESESIEPAETSVSIVK